MTVGGLRKRSEVSDGPQRRTADNHGSQAGASASGGVAHLWLRAVAYARCMRIHGVLELP